MAQTTILGLLTIAMSLAIGAGGAGALRHAAAIPGPIEPARRTFAGEVTEVITQTCGYTNRSWTCYRPVVGYLDGGRPRQVVARSASHPSPSKKGDAASVFVFADGTAWIASEWQRRQDERWREHDSARRTPTVIGWILIGCAGFGTLIGLGLIFWIDRSGAPA